MQIGYGDTTATEQLRDARQTYCNLLLAILQGGIAQGIFHTPNVLDVETGSFEIVLPQLYRYALMIAKIMKYLRNLKMPRDRLEHVMAAKVQE